jgi:16S rRNA (guanine527-N7)-methyltransferase
LFPELPPTQRNQLESLVAMLADPAAPTSVRERGDAWNVHILDSLSGLDVGELREARLIADLGAGAGFPGLVLAAALPDARVDLIEATGRKCEYMRAAAAAAGIANARVVHARSEEWAADPPPAGGRDAYDVVTARAVSTLAADAELASPLLHEGGLMVAWKGERSDGEERELGAAAAELAMAPVEVRPAAPYPSSRARHLHLVRKTAATPAALPRRPGVATKRRGGAPGRGRPVG